MRAGLQDVWHLDLFDSKRQSSAHAAVLSAGSKCQQAVAEAAEGGGSSRSRTGARNRTPAKI